MATLRKILWHSVSPRWGTGYGTQTAVWVPRIAALGYEVAISAFVGEPPGITEWLGHPVYPPGNDRYGADVLADHARHFGADLIITFLDCYSLDPEPWADRLKGRVACWMPVDADDGRGLINRHMGLSDHLKLLQSGAQPIAISEWGQKQMFRQKHHPLFVPHGIDCSAFVPPADKKAVKAAMGLDGKFVIGINATNIGNLNRKAWTEQLGAFAKLHRRHADTFLLAHCDPNPGKIGYNLKLLAEEMGIRTAVAWGGGGKGAYAYRTGQITQGQMIASYGLMDLLSSCSYAEGFGLPILEAEACGVPTVVTDASAMSEVGSGWKVQGEPFFSVIHHAYWRQPQLDDIYAVYEKVYDLWKRGALTKGVPARQHALIYDADTVLTQHWKPVLAKLEAMLP